MNVVIQSANLDHLNDIQELNHQLCIKENKEFDASINKDYPIQKVGETYFRKRIQNDFACVATLGNKVIGYLVGSIIKPEEYRNVRKLAEAENMFVLEEYQSMGVGKKLLDAFVEWCGSRSVERIRLVASAQNLKAIHLYRREGFLDHHLALEKEL